METSGVYTLFTEVRNIAYSYYSNNFIDIHVTNSD